MASPSPIRSSPLQPEDWLRAGFARLAAEGLEAVRVEVLSRDLGVSKGSFYWHFQDREELLAKMLDRWEAEEASWLEAAVRGVHSPASRWARLVDRSGDPGRLRLEAALHAWARKDAGTAQRITALERKRGAYIDSVLREIGFDPASAARWADLVMLVYLGWLDRTTRDAEFPPPGLGLGEFLSEMILAASARPSAKAQTSEEI